MNISHFTNTFLPHVGGVARAVQTLLTNQLKQGHDVLVVAPEFEEGPAKSSIEKHITRIPALTKFNETDFSVRLPTAAWLSDRLATFEADLIHAHHPFLLGGTAMREAASRQVPLIFTHHTLYERYTHYLPFDSEALQAFAADLATRFANHCDAVIAPSESVRKLIMERGVTVPVHVVPTGVETRLIAKGSSQRARTKWKIPQKAKVTGHVGRLAAEKNLSLLTESICQVLLDRPTDWALIVGEGPERESMEEHFRTAGVNDRVIFTGTLAGKALHDAFAAMDVFAFTSTSETQGLVLAEAMAAGCPVVALNASGSREVVRNTKNGCLLRPKSKKKAIARAISEILQDSTIHARYRKEAKRTAADFDHEVTSKRLSEIYAEVVHANEEKTRDEHPLETLLDPLIARIVTEGKIIFDQFAAAKESAWPEESPTTRKSTTVTKSLSHAD